MNSNEIKELAGKVIMQTYGRYDLALASGDGTTLTDPEGNNYLDFVSGLAVASLGHANKELADVMVEQARKLVHVSNLYFTEPQVLLAKALVDNSFADRVFFCNSGAEANEAAIKLARKYSFDKYGEGRHKFLSMKDSFHGRTMSTIAVTGQPDKHVGFTPLMNGIKFLPLNDTEALREALTDEVCAVIIEPIQGEGGVNKGRPEYLEAMRQLCTEKDVLLIFDEIQVGMGRTGSLFAYEQYGVEPDIMTLAKALANGLPIGAALAREEVAATFGPGTHASTFGGTPLVCAVANAVMEKMTAPGFLENVREMGEYFIGKLEEIVAKHEFALEVKGRGLILGLKVSFPGGDVVNSLMQKGFLINCIQGSILRFLPPLTITTAEIDRLIPVLEGTLIEAAALAEI